MGTEFSVKGVAMGPVEHLSTELEQVPACRTFHFKECIPMHTDLPPPPLVFQWRAKNLALISFSYLMFHFPKAKTSPMNLPCTLHSALRDLKTHPDSGLSSVPWMPVMKNHTPPLDSQLVRNCHCFQWVLHSTHRLWSNHDWGPP